MQWTSVYALSEILAYTHTRAFQEKCTQTGSAGRGVGRKGVRIGTKAGRVGSKADWQEGG